ncbi:MAG: sulfurtransferase, partial [Thermomicrobiales bacterium]
MPVRSTSRMTRRSALASLGLTLLGLGSSPSNANADQNNESSTPYIVSAAEIVRRIREEPAALRLLDASSLREYRAEHLPGATHVFWEDTVDRNYPVFGAVVTQGFEQQQRLDVVSRFGVRQIDDIIVYDRRGGFRAARIVWFLRFLGFSKVALLDGGVAAWQAIEGPLDSGTIEPPHVTPSVSPQDGFYVVTEALRDRLESKSSQVLDIRNDEELTDTLGGQIPTGRIPGSIPFPWDQMIDWETNLVRPRAELRTSLTDAGITGEQDIVVVARFGVEAAFSWLVLRLSGFERVL